MKEGLTAPGNRKVALINFFNPKSLGIRFIEQALSEAGYDVVMLHIGGFRGAYSVKPGEAEIREFMELLGEPLWIGFSVISYFYQEIAAEVTELIRQITKAPLVWGGVYTTLLPDRCLDFCDYVIRGEGEASAVEFSERLAAGADVSDMQNLAYRANGETVVNPVRPFETNLDLLGVAELGLSNKYFINDGKLYQADPGLDSYSYETSASRGCPYACTYCSSSNLKRMYGNASHYTRYRSARHVIDELKSAKAKMKNLSLIRFWDEVFSSDPAWIDEFSALYKSEIGIPFEMWTHPLKINGAMISKLVGAGMRFVGMGIQSGSPEVRKKVFRRAESQEQIMQAAKTLADCRVPQVVYDFIIGHPLETAEQMKESYALCSELPGKFTLQLHGLAFLPGTDIVEETIKRGVFTREEMDAIMYKPMERLYLAWNVAEVTDPEKLFWYRVTYLTQFPTLRGAARRLSQKPGEEKSRKKAARYYSLSRYFSKLRLVRNKGINVILERRK